MKRLLFGLVVGVLIFAMPIAALSHGDEHQPTSTATPHGPVAPTFISPTLPPDAQPPGERNPLIALVAAGAIVIAGGAGIFIYRTIKEGL